MIKFIVFAVLLLVTGCTANNNVTHKQSIPKQTRILTHTHTASPATTVTKASSTATSVGSRVNQPSVTIKEAPNGAASDLLDQIGTPVGNPANQAPAGNTGGQMPTGNPAYKVPAGYPGTQAPTGNTGEQTPARNPFGQPGTRSPGGKVPTGPAGQTPEGKTDSSQFAHQVLYLVNQERSKAGLGTLSMSSELSNMAMVKAQDMYNNNYFGHDSPTHGSPFDMMKEFGITYNSAGENIANGQTTPTQVMNEWMNSPGHKANILNTSFTQIGIAFYNNEWVQEFTG